MDVEFKNFIISLIKRGNVSTKNCDKFTKDLSSFKLAFVHKTYDEIDNYELLELVGDGIVNSSVICYLRKWNPKIVNVKYLTRLKHNIMSVKSLAEFAEKAGFWKWIKIGDELREHFNSMDEETKHKDTGTFGYMSILEDSFEAFIGALKEVVDENTENNLGYIVCYRVIESFLKEVNISLNYKDIFDAKTRYKELCDKRAWEFKTCLKTYEEIYQEEVGGEIKDKKRYKSVVYGYPYGNCKKEEKNKEKLGEKTCNIKMDAENGACEMALSRLHVEFDIFDIPPDPYKKKN